MEISNQGSGRILVVEDDVPTSSLLTQAFEETAPEVTIEVVGRGDDAIERLEATAHGKPMPDLVLLDLDLPGKSGREVLEWREGRKEASRIPVVVLSDVSSAEAVNQCYDLRAQSFLSKPSNWEEFLGLADVVVEYWFVHANAPVVTTDPPSPSYEVPDTTR